MSATVLNGSAETTFGVSELEWREMNVVGNSQRAGNLLNTL